MSLSKYKEEFRKRITPMVLETPLVLLYNTCMQTKSKNLLITVVSILLLVGVVIFLAPNFFNKSEPTSVMCTQEAKQCPDGSYVGRTGPKCEFAMCPGASTTIESLKVFSDNKLGISFQYPENPVVKYMDAIDWPPKVQILDQAFSCTEGGSETSRAGGTVKKVINGREYCLTKVSEGAAGSTYTQYAYAFPRENKTVIFTFSIRYVQCGNYDESQKTECENLRQSFDLNTVIDKIAQTFKFI